MVGGSLRYYSMKSKQTVDHYGQMVEDVHNHVQRCNQDAAELDKVLACTFT